MSISIIAILVTIAVFMFLTRKVPEPPKVENEQDLLDDGYTKKEMREELRKQRNEHRQHARLKNDAMRTGATVGRLVKRANRISKKW